MKGSDSHPGDDPGIPAFELRLWSTALPASGAQFPRGTWVIFLQILLASSQKFPWVWLRGCHVLIEYDLAAQALCQQHLQGCLHSPPLAERPEQQLVSYGSVSVSGLCE